jgi:hypothetical protein
LEEKMKIKIYTVDFEIPSRIKRWSLRIGIPLTVLLGGGAIAWASGLHTWANGDPLNAADLNGNFTQVENEISALQPYLVSYANGGGKATIPAGQWSELSFPSKLIDDTTNAVSSGGTWSFTAPAAGTYAIKATICFSDATTTGPLALSVWLNANTALVTSQRTGFGSSDTMDINDVVSISAGDTLSVWVNAAGGTNLGCSEGQRFRVMVEGPLPTK